MDILFNFNTCIKVSVIVYTICLGNTAVKINYGYYCYINYSQNCDSQERVNNLFIIPLVIPLTQLRVYNL